MPREYSYRPSLSISKLNLIHTLLQKHFSEDISYAEKVLVRDTMYVIRKELQKAQLDIAGSTMLVSDADRKTNKSITGLELFDDAELTAISKELVSDKDKISLMSKEEQEKYWEEQMNGIVGNGY